MLEPSLPANEEERMAALLEYQILDSLPEKDFDEITKIASEICGTPISLITLVDTDRQWFKSRYGLAATETERAYSFCAHAILQPDVPFVVPDADHDDRFSDNPLTTGQPLVKFYAGIPLVNPEGLPLGSLCVIDHQKRDISEKQLEALKALANQVAQLLELRKTVLQLRKTQDQLKLANRNLNEFAYLMAHDIKAPIRQVRLISDIFLEDFKEQLNEDGMQLLEQLANASKDATDMVNGILRYSKSTHYFRDNKTLVDLSQTLPRLISRLSPPEHILIHCSDVLPTILISELALNQILSNLISNAIKYHDKTNGWVRVDVEQNSENLKLRISDNGRGIAEDQQQAIFDLFYRINKTDAQRHDSSGVGLAIVKRLVGDLGGSIRVRSELGQGSVFEVELPVIVN
jgi:hypothetical protein